MAVTVGRHVRQAGAARRHSSQTDGTTKRTQKSKKAKQSFLDEPAFISGYRSAYATIYEQHDYARAIEQLRALGHDDYANVANLIGYSYRKLGDYSALADLVRARPEVRPEPRADLAVLRALADRAGQPGAGAVSPDADRRDLRHDVRGISLAGSRARASAGHRAGLLTSA